MPFSVGSVAINKNSVTIIAEAGVNHNGSIDEAKRLALAAKENGAEIIKFQTYKSEKLSSPKAKKFWNKALDKSEYQEETYSKLDSFEEKDYLALKEYCDFIGIEFLSTPFDLESVDLLTRVGVRAFKIASCDITNFQLIEKVAKTKLPIFLSTGASNLAEIDEAVDFILKFHNKLVLLHCVLCYPTENKDANILSIQVLAKRYSELVIGYSDHTKDIYSAIGSVALGSRVIEKHFTLSKNDSKPGDHWFAIDSEDLRQLSSGSRAVLSSLGSKIKEVFDCEIKAREQARRSIHLAASVDEGQIAKENDFIMLRPGTGIEPKYVKSLVGRKYTRKMEKFEQVKKTDLV